MVDHLSSMDHPDNEASGRDEVNDAFLEESLYLVQGKIVSDAEPKWFPDLTNYLVGRIILMKFSCQRRKKFLSTENHYVWEDQVLRRCVSHSEG